MHPPEGPKIFVALPVLDELDLLPITIQCIQNQSNRNFELFVCVNQPDEWWQDDTGLPVCGRNRETIKYLNGLSHLPVTVIDKSSKGKGWIGKRHGVGWARKVLMDSIAAIAKPSDLILSLDADTRFNNDYFKSLVETFSNRPDAAALSVPYYHELTNDKNVDRLILRYEIYMRYYALNLWLINNPYSFSALGSAIVVPVSTYQAISGITPHLSGEDFYFLQKIRKYKPLIHWNEEWVYPAARFSNRVYFGTGPAMIKGKSWEWSSYPIYENKLFKEVKTTFDMFSDLYKNDIETPMSSFLKEVFCTSDLWGAIRKNYSTREQFISACSKKVDGLRILQYLKYRQKTSETSDETNLVEFLKNNLLHNVSKSFISSIEGLSFRRSPIALLNEIRDLLMKSENEYRKRAF